VPRVDLTLSVDIERSARVLQTMGIFDVPERKTAAVEYHFEVPLHERPWQVGLIVGPSGAGKSTVARHLFADALREGYEWRRGAAIVDNFGDRAIKDIVGALSSVGLSSPPAWLKPFEVLSNGERFRVNLARAILDDAKTVCIDEFTSVVDRQVARVGAHAVAKAVRAINGKRLVAVTCHEDVLDWLQPDWVLEPHVGAFSWRSVQRRPGISVEIVRCERSAWKMFAQHHYLTTNIHEAAQCAVALISQKPVAFTSWLHLPHPRVRNFKREHRTVVLPDYQGCGIGAALSRTIGAICKASGFRFVSTTSHPSFIRHRAASPDWRTTRVPSNVKFPSSSRVSCMAGLARSYSVLRRTASFEYVGAAWPDRDEAALFMRGAAS
jgi:ABC-type ATPase involved in cell division/GNAT superfamily N-acetyltransferase